MKLPETSDLLLPMLELMQDGNEYHLQDISKKLAQRFEFSSTGEIKDRTLDAQFYSRVVGARSYMTQARLLESTRRGVSKISPRGHELLAESPQTLTIKSLVRYPEFLDYLKTSTSENLQDYVSVVPPQKSSGLDELNGHSVQQVNGSNVETPAVDIEQAFNLSGVSILNENLDEETSETSQNGLVNVEVVEEAKAIEEAKVEEIEESQEINETDSTQEDPAVDFLNTEPVVQTKSVVEVKFEPVVEVDTDIEPPFASHDAPDEDAPDEIEETEEVEEVDEIEEVEESPTDHIQPESFEEATDHAETNEVDEVVEEFKTDTEEAPQAEAIAEDKAMVDAEVEEPSAEEPDMQEPPIEEPVQETSAELINQIEVAETIEEEENSVFQWIEPNEDPVLAEEPEEIVSELHDEAEITLSVNDSPVEEDQIEEERVNAITMNENIKEPFGEQIDEIDSIDESLNNVTEIPESDFVVEPEAIEEESMIHEEPVPVVSDLSKTQDSLPAYKDEESPELITQPVDIKERQPSAKVEPESQVVPYSSKPVETRLTNQAASGAANEGIASLIQVINQLQTASQGSNEYQLQQPAAQGRQEERLSPGMFTLLIIMRFLENWFQHFWLYTIPLILMLAAYGASFYILSDEFVSKGVLFVQTETLIDQVASIGEDNVDFFLSPSEQTADEITELLNTDSFIRLIISRTPTLEAEMANGDKVVRETIIDVRESIAVNITGSNNVEVSASWDEQETAWKTADAALNSYIEWKINSEKRDSAAAREFLENLVPQYQNEFRATVQSLEEYLINHPEPFRGERPEIEQLQINQLEIASQTAFDRFQAASQDLEEIRLQEVIIEGATKQSYTIVDTPKIPVEEEGGLLRKVITGVVFITLGIVLSLLAIVASTLVDRSVRFPIESPSALGLPVLSSVQRIEDFDLLSGDHSG